VPFGCQHDPPDPSCHNSLLHILDVMHLDGNKENNHAGNLIWKFPSGGLRHPRYKDFSYIPGYSKYIINKNGVLIDHKEDIVIGGGIIDSRDF
jgi:hypothetical protein